MMTHVAPADRLIAEQRTGLAILCAGLTAALGWTALAIECGRSLSISFGVGRSLGEALFLYFHFFTILTNIGVATLMSLTFLRLRRGAPLPTAPLYSAALIYILVTCVTYELVLRNIVKPSGLQFFTDATIHDIVPALTLVFWLAFAPRQGASWRDPLWMLAYPTAYLALTLVAGALGEGYPYSFLDVDKIGYGGVAFVSAIFLVVFYGLGLATTGLSIRLAAHAGSTRT